MFGGLLNHLQQRSKLSGTVLIQWNVTSFWKSSPGHRRHGWHRYWVGWLLHEDRSEFLNGTRLPLLYGGLVEFVGDFGQPAIVCLHTHMLDMFAG
jgi:hypothetical protein